MTQQIIDLSLSLFTGVRGVSTEPATTIASKGYNTTNLHLYSHAGTHMDAPLHFVDGGNTIDKVDLHKCVGPALLIDLSHTAPNAQIMVADVAPYQDKIGPGSRVLLRTDWDKHAHLDDYRTYMPRISAELAHWLVEKGVVMVGVQTPSVASLRPENKAELTEVHQILLKAEMIIVEGLTNLDQIQQEMVQFVALPLKVRDCDGSPVRAIAIVD